MIWLFYLQRDIAKYVYRLLSICMFVYICVCVCVSTTAISHDMSKQVILFVYCQKEIDVLLPSLRC